MTEKLAPQVEQGTELEKTAEYEGGKVDYSVIGETTDHNPVVLVPGFTIGRLVQRDFANTLHEEGDRQVIFSEQPNFSWKPSMKPVVDRHAEALLAIIETEGLNEKPVDFIAHSFGAIIFTRAAELAKERGVASFNGEFGSRAVFIAPAGTNKREGIIRLGPRFIKFMKNGAPLGKELDPDGEWMKAGMKNARSRPLKTLKEVGVLRKKEAIYNRLGAMGIKPSLLGYESDDLMPFRSAKSVVMNEDKPHSGYSVPIDIGDTPLKGAKPGINLKEYQEITGLDKQKATKQWARYVIGAGHNDLLFNPHRTVNAVLPILDGDMVERSKIATKNYLERQASPPKKTIRIVL